MSGGVATDAIDETTINELLDDAAGHLNAQHGRLLDLTVWLLANPSAWQGDGVWTPAQYLAWRCGIGPHTARNLVDAARRAGELPVAVDALRRGEMSLDQLMPIVRTAPAWADAQIVSLAKRLTVTQIRRTVNRTDWHWTPGPADPTHDAGPVEDGQSVDGTEPVEATPPSNEQTEAIGHDAAGRRSCGHVQDPNRVWYGIGDDGRWHLHADLDLDLGELVATALNEARDHQRAASPQAARPVTDVDALVEIAHRSLDAVSTVQRRNRFRVNMYLDTAAVLTTDHGVALPASIAQLLTCDGTIDPVFVTGGKPVSVGRTQRTVPDRTRRTVLARDDHHCQIPGCATTRGLDLHHIIHWAHDGPTDTWNLITLCARHHRLHHTGGLGITGNADRPSTLRFTDRRGHPIRPSGAQPRPPDGPPPPITGTYEHPVGEHLDHRWITFRDPTIAPLRRPDPPDLTAYPETA